MKNTVIGVIVFVTMFFVSCEKSDDFEINRMRVNHYQQPVDWAESFYGMSYVVQIDDEIDTEGWHVLGANIYGFEYEPGYIYDLVVKRESVDNPPIDGAIVKYTLQEILSKQPVSEATTFDITLSIVYSNGFYTYVMKDEFSNYSLLNQTKIDCGDLSEELDEYLKQEVGLVGTFKYKNESTIELISLRIDE